MLGDFVLNKILKMAYAKDYRIVFKRVKDTEETEQNVKLTIARQLKASLDKQPDIEYCRIEKLLDSGEWGPVD